MKPNEISGGTIVFEFVDGPRAGDCVRSDQATDADSTNEATAYFAMTRGASVGRTFRASAAGEMGQLLGQFFQGGSSCASEKHVYRIVRRDEHPTEIRLTAQYVSSS